jgi:hypothetical protein
VFVDAVGTGYSQAIANTNADFWGVDKDAAAFRDFVRRYVAVNKREASPKFLFGESYGAPRTAVLANLLETAGVQIDGLVLLGHHGLQQQLRRARSQRHQLRGLHPDLRPHQRLPRARGACRWTACAASPPAATAPRLRLTLPAMLRRRPPCWPAVRPDRHEHAGVAAEFRHATRLLPAERRGQPLGRYDARAGPGGQRAGARWRSLADRGQRYFSSSIVSYLAGELHSAGSAYAPFIDIVNRWNFSHDGKQLPDTIPDLAAALTLNPAMKIMAASGYHDLATPFHQTDLDLARLGENHQSCLNIMQAAI